MYGENFNRGCFDRIWINDWIDIIWVVMFNLVWEATYFNISTVKTYISLLIHVGNFNAFGQFLYLNK